MCESSAFLLGKNNELTRVMEKCSRCNSYKWKSISN